jgi:hypothetical protein
MEAQVPAAMLQHLVESLPRGVEAVIAAKGLPAPYECPCFGNEMFEEQVSTYFWSCSVYAQFSFSLPRDLKGAIWDSNNLVVTSTFLFI